MKIIWNGHSCFTLQTAQGTVVVDPFADNYVPGCGVIRPEADGVYCSHGHNDHGCAEVVTLSGNAHTVEVETIPSYHIFTAEGMRCVHLGDLGCELNEEQLSAIGTPDILFVPVGGFYTIDANQAADIVTQLNPRIVVPMHYKGEGFGSDVLTPVDNFLTLCSGTVKVLSGSSFDVTSDTPTQVIVPALPNNN